MVVQHNIAALNANRYYGINNSGLSSSLEKLSSGYAINRAGDNAAGLAVSEKMRSQIAGLTQGVKNAEDGISMIQTFEGALTETDSILQRMKTLATQAANGTYQDDVDRDAIQLEFNQLNDELNQIADTDFNGVIVLNGGEMADGTKAVDGKFDYSNKADQVAAANSEKLKALQTAAQEKIDTAETKFKLAAITLKGTPIDMTNNGAATEYNTVDNHNYGKTEADALWSDLGLTGKTVDGKTVDSDATEVELTFTVDSIDATTGEITWKITNATSNASDKVNFSDADLLTAADGNIIVTDKSGNSTDDTTASGKGGFLVNSTTNTTTAYADGIANATVNTKNAKVGDTITLKFTNAASEQYAPANISMDKDSLKNTAGTENSDIKISLSDALVDNKMTADVKDALNVLNNTKVVADYDSNGNVTVSLTDDQGINVNDLTIEEDATTAGTYNIKMKDGTVLASVEGLNNRVKTLSTDDTWTADDIDDGGYLIYEDGAWTAYKADGSTSTATYEVSTADGKTNTGRVFVDGDRIDLDGGTANTNLKFTPASGLGSGRVEFGIAVDSFNFSENGGPTVEPGKDNNIDSELAVANQKAYDKAKAELQAAKDAYPTALEDGVSVSDALNNATAPLTYTDHVMLQAGARSKDLVDFTFNYSSGGLGDLTANMNCSAREDGLGTDSLSLKTQEDANYAIDRIDNAINKVSMVRATFGAVQNRLEHKIDNMNVTLENITSAESRIRDTDMAAEMTNFTKNQILSQASQAMLAQANTLPQGVLQLLG